jgi:hypothetical protein
MNRKQISALSKIVVSLALASVLGLAAYVILMGMPSPAMPWFPLQNGTHPPAALAQDTYTRTIFLPIAFNNYCQSTRPPLKGIANFPGEIEILTPLNCTTGIGAETPIIASGTYAGTPADVTLWVLAYAPNDKYYPQSPNACQGEPPYQKDGDWHVPVYLGERGGPPEQFDIVVILTDQATSQFLSNHVKEGCRLGQYVGLSAVQLNQMAITEKDYITVQTLD